MTDVRLTGFGFLNFQFNLLNVKKNCLHWVLELSESMELTTDISKGFRSEKLKKKNCEKHWDVFRLAYLSVEIQKRFFGMTTGRIVI